MAKLAGYRVLAYAAMYCALGSVLTSQTSLGQGAGVLQGGHDEVLGGIYGLLATSNDAEEIRVT